MRFNGDINGQAVSGKRSLVGAGRSIDLIQKRGSLGQPGSGSGTEVVLGPEAVPWQKRQ
jgi:hypothetical protein